MSNLSIERVAQFVLSPLDNPLTRGEQMELAQFFLEIQRQITTFKALPDTPITDDHIKQVINGYEKGWAMMIVPYRITYGLAKEVQAKRAMSEEE
ncbi:hypothetical protein ABT929_004231 [Salmonella enterica subsp. enterica serovar Uganda]|uniref:Uncharacterized protein n=2 Tax=Salmonella enterica TaxID=28901 RepID=A0A742QE89_SALER|nr:hypothetical protein [Salmonella enterica]EAB5862707.1 hypothetical protein [Salmonella enterica subsp. enterica serovar Cairina]EAC1010552.1 hypothetical protein [Salmonella enterica subsp. enterica serovar Jangwani]EBQ6102666.1 hypothetical protein [Salmonella enterica subsp. enterica serovar Ibadan]EBU7586218.1 hypothetical protein [Salmonella enterica subsp. enterica serovar Montevideo]EBU8484956.1 hypothetical protein [Salmonella enterica subsp. enterica serovar Newport]ECG1710522.1 h